MFYKCLRRLLSVSLVLPLFGFMVGALSFPVSGNTPAWEVAFAKNRDSLDKADDLSATLSLGNESNVTLDGNWSHYEMYVLKKLEDIDKRLACIEDRTNANSLAVGVLNVKAGMWGGLGGVGASILTILGNFFVSKRGRKNGGVTVERCEN